MDLQTKIYGQLELLHEQMIDILFKKLGCNFDPVDEKIINEVYGTGTRRMIQIDILTKKLSGG